MLTPNRKLSEILRENTGRRKAKIKGRYYKGVQPILSRLREEKGL